MLRSVKTSSVHVEAYALLYLLHLSPEDDKFMSDCVAIKCLYYAQTN